MKSQILRNLKKIALVNGLALLFVLITFSSTLATATSIQGNQSTADLYRLSSLQTDRPAAVGSIIQAMPAEDRVSPNPQAAPQTNSSSGSSLLAVPEVATLISGTLSQDWGDFDRDGYLDLALGTYDGVTLYHNNGVQLAFSQAITVGPVYGVRWADLDNNGLLELVTVRNTPGANGIYHFAGTGFISYTAFTSALPLARVVVISGTTRDLIASTSAISVPCAILRFSNNGNRGYFNTAVPTCVSTAPTAGIGAGDFNNDGYPDLVAGSFPNEVKLLISNRGVLTEASTPQKNSFTFDHSSSWPYDFAWGDYDGDGRLDLAAAFPLQRQVRVYHNEGPNSNPPFKLSGVLPTQRFMTPLSLDWGDFNGDGAPDLAVADDPPRIYFNVNKSISALSSTRIRDEQPTDEVMWNTRAVALANNDLSVALSGEFDPARLYATVGGHLQPEILPLGVSVAANSVAWGDATGDGRIDLLIGALTGTVPSTLYRNVSGTITTTGASTLVNGRHQHVAFGNFDKRNRQLGFVIGDTSNTGQSRINIYKQLGGNPSTWSLTEPVGAVALGDFNDDGWLDLLVGTQNQNGNGTILLYRNVQGDLLSSPAFITTVVGQVRGVAWAGSYAPAGYMDFAVVTSDRVYVFHNDRNNAFTATSLEELNDYTSVVWGDFDGESGPELAVGINGEGVRLYRYSNESLTSIWSSPYLSHTTSLASGDWDNDGRIDLAVGNDGEPTLVYANSNTTPGSVDLTPVWSSQDRGSTTAVAWGDVNDDGYLDLAVSRQDGSNGVYYNTSVTPWRLPTPPTYLSIARPGRAFDAYLYSSSDFLPGYSGITTPTLAPTTTIYYTVFNPAGTFITNTQLEFSVDGGTNWQAASYTGTVVPTQTSSSGRAGVLIWDARQDQAFSDDALLRVRVVDQVPVGPFQRAADVAVSPPFRVRAMSCQWLSGLWIDVQPGNIVQPNERVIFGAETSEHPWGAISYTWIIADGSLRNVISGGFSQIPYVYRNRGRFQVLVRATSEQCSEGPTLEAVTYMQVGTISNTYQLYLPLLQRSSATARSTAREVEHGNSTPQRSSMAAPLGGTTACISRSISPSSRPTVAWLTGTIGYYGQPVLNHDGSRFAFWSTANLAGTNSDGNIELYYAQVDRVRSCITFTQITSSTGNILEGFNLGPAINATGDKLAFFSDRNLTGENADQNFEVFLANVNANGSISVTQFTHSVREVNALPAISADGKRIAFVSDQRNLVPGGNPDGNQEIFVATIDASGQIAYTQLTQTDLDTFNDEPSLSSEGQRVAFVRGGSQTGGIQQIFVGNADVPNSSLITITSSPTDVLSYHPTIGGSGSQYSVAYATTNLTQEVVKFATIMGTDVNVRPIYTTTLNSLPALNVTDGSRLVVVSDVQRIKVLVPEQSDIIPIYNCAVDNTDCAYPAISGDGMHVAFTAKGMLQEAYYETAALSLTLSQPTLPVVAGAKLTRTITLVNNGPSSADGVVFSITLLADTTTLPVTIETSPDGMCSGSGTMYCYIPGLPGSSSAYITLTTNNVISPDRLDPVSLMAGANAWQASSVAINPSIPVATEADLQVTKDVAPAAVAGELVTYTLRVVNAGPSLARYVTLTDRLPDDVIFRNQSNVGNLNFTLTNTAGMITDTIDLLPNGTSATIQVIAQLGTTAPTGKIISNTGVVTSSTYDPSLENNLNLKPFAVTTRSDLTVTKLAPVTVTAGLPLTYTIIVTNNGPSTAVGLALTDTLPSSMTVSFVSPSNCQVSGMDSQIVTCSLPDLNVGTGIRQVVTVTTETDPGIEEDFVLKNTVSMSATNATKAVSNTATTRTKVGSYLYLTKTATSAVTAGEPLTYTILVENRGPSQAWRLTLTDLWSTNYISYTGYSISNDYGGDLGSCNYTPGQIVCLDWYGLRSYETQTYNFYAKTYQTLTVGTPILNTAYVTSTGNFVTKYDTATTQIDNSISHLVVGKLADPTVLAGDFVHYTVTVTNTGPSYAPYVTVTDELPTGVTFASSPDCVPAGGNNVECHISDLYVGAAQRQTVTLIGNVSYAVDSGTRLTNTAEITASNAAASVSATAGSMVRTSSILTIEKKATNAVTTVTDPFASGEIVTYTIVVTNIGPSLARNVILTDVLPVSVTYLSHVSANPPVTPAIPGQTLTWSLNTIAPTATVAVTFTGRVLTSTVGLVTLTNTAYVTSTTAPIIVTDTASTAVLPRVRLAVTKNLLTSQPVEPQSDLTYQILLQNLGPSVVPSVLITDVLRAGADTHNGVNHDEIVVNGATCNTPAHQGITTTITCTVTPELVAGASRVITLTAPTNSHLDDSPTFTNTVYANAAIATEVVSDTKVGTTIARASLKITKTLSPLNAVAVAGGVLTYVVTVGNEGPSDVSQLVTLTDTLPAELLNVQLQPPSNCSGPVSRVVTCTVGFLDYNSTWSITVTGRLTDNLPAGWVITNTAQATTTIASAVATGSLTTTVGVLADLRISKLAAATARAGELLTYTIIVTNGGPSLAPSVRITDVLPISVTYLNQLGAVPSIASPISTGRLLTWTLLSNLAPSATQIITFNVRITNTVGGSARITNTAYVTSTSAPAVDVDPAGTYIQDRADLVLTKTVLTPNPIAGGVLTYGITVTNLGPSPIPVAAVVITDRLPTALSYKSSTPGCPALNSVITCTSSSILGVGSSWPITISADIGSGAITTFTNTAYATSTIATAGVSHSVATTPIVQFSLRMTKAATFTVLAGNALTYTIFITNDGPSLASSLVVTDQLPSQLGSPSASSGCTPDQGIVTCTAFPLDKDGSRTITVTGQVTASTPAGTVITNTAYVSSTVDATRFSRQVTTTVQTLADLGVNTAINPTSVFSNTGGPVKVTINFVNAGPSDARSVYITETLGILTYTAPIAQPAYVGDPTGSNCNGGSVPHQCVWLISSTLPANLNGTIEFTATAPSTGISYTQRITASIASTTNDIYPGNNSTSTELRFVQMLPRMYWAGLLPVRWPVALLNALPRDFWSLSP